MNWKTWFPLILAIVLGVVAAKAAHDWVMKNKAAEGSSGKFTKVVVATGDTQPGKELTAEDLTLSQIEAANAPSNALTSTEEVVGRVNEIFMVKGQPIVESMLAPKGAGSGLQALIPNGQRAITLEVNEFTGVAGLIIPGCRVDIISTLQGGDGGQVTRTIVQNVKVTATGQRTTAAGEPPPQNPNEMFRSVTVLVKPDEAEAIELACATSRPRLVLRGGRDNEIVASAGISIGELRGNKKGDIDLETEITSAPTTQPGYVATTQPFANDVVAQAEPPRRKIKVIRGGQETFVTLDIIDGSPANAITDTEANKDPFGSH